MPYHIIHNTALNVNVIENGHIAELQFCNLFMLHLGTSSLWRSYLQPVSCGSSTFEKKGKEALHHTIYSTIYIVTTITKGSETVQVIIIHYIIFLQY